MVDAYLHANFHLDPSNRLVTIHQHYRQTGQTDRTGQIDNGLVAYGEPFYKRLPKNIKTKLAFVSLYCKSHLLKTANIKILS